MRQFHQAGFVHGDICDMNIMVKETLNQDGLSFLVIDFDSCGELKQARYPLLMQDPNTIQPSRLTLISRVVLIKESYIEGSTM